jgi:phosphohistidine phosphatase
VRPLNVQIKQLLIIRHAKSSWDIASMKDFDRPLNQRGLHDAPMMAKRLLDKKVTIDAFISSTAKRAFTTASYFAETFSVAEKNIIKVPNLYHAAPSIFYEVIKNIDDHFSSIAVFSHNPGITTFVNQLTTTQIDDMPTCGIFGITIKTATWKDFATAEKAFWFFDYPKA